MTLLKLSNVAAAIAALTVPGITLCDLNAIPQAVDTRKQAVFAPSVDRDFLTDWEAVRINFQGGMRNSYTLHYTLYQAPIGAERGLFVQYPALVENVERVVGAIQALPRVDGCKSIALFGMPKIGPVVDASNQAFHGAIFAIRVIEF